MTRFEAFRSRGGTPLLLDSACGTRLIDRGLSLADSDPSLWVLDRAGQILDLHRRDVSAGSDILLTATFGANRRRLALFGRSLEVEALNRRAVAIAREVAEDRLVVGSIGPPIDRDGIRDLREQAEWLRDAGCDAIAFETFDPTWASVVLKECRRSLLIPFVVSLHSPRSYPADALKRLEADGADVLGANCQADLLSATLDLEFLARSTSLPLWLKPGGGLPGGPPIGPQSFSEEAKRWLALGVGFLGGCCGTDESHLAALRLLISSAGGLSHP